MQIVEKEINKLIPYEKNPRKNDDAVEYVANSIKEFGFRVPIVIDKDNVVVCGHTRLKAAKKLKLKTVPCVIADDLNAEQIKAFRLADNRVGEMASWDFDMLDGELAEIFNVNMLDFGFEDTNTDDTELPSSGGEQEFCKLTLTLHKRQKNLILDVCKKIKDDVSETFGNQNSRGNAIYEICKQWNREHGFKIKD